MKSYDKAEKTAEEVIKETGENTLAWAIKLVSLTEESRIIDEDLSDMTIGEELFSENEMQKDARPGTSLKTPNTKDGTFNYNGPSVRPQTGSRPLSGYSRPGTSTRPGTGTNRLDTGRLNTGISRPLTNQGRRLKTGQVGDPNGPFLNLSRLNFKEFAENQNLAKVLFEHISIVLGEYRQGLNFTEIAQSHASSKDNVWKYYQSLACLRLGMVRRAEEFGTEFVRENSLPCGALLLSSIYKRLDQPLAARQALKVGIENNPDNLLLMANFARLEEARGSFDEAEKIFDKMLSIDPINQEALCVLAASKYYKDEPMACLSLYRRALQTGHACAALYNNLALASIATGQVDLGFRCFTKALQESTSDDELEQIWYNIGNTCIFIGEFQLAQQGKNEILFV